jgi:hypothetical protein
MNKRMENICITCAIDPTSHSFKKISENHNVVIYYTNPSKAKHYTDTKGILSHYDKTLALLGNKKWIWIFDSENFGLKHALEIKTGIGIAKLLTEKYSHNLLEIKIINPTWHIKSMMAIVWPFLNNSTKNKINILADRYYSIIEFY